MTHNDCAQMKAFDISMPGWADSSVPEQRMHLRLYYSDMLAAHPVAPPVAADCDTWEVEEMKKFVLAARPRTRLDAYPLLIATQDVLRRVAEKKVRIISQREQALQSNLEALTFERDHLKHQLELACNDLHKEKVTAKFNLATSVLIKPKEEVSVDLSVVFCIVVKPLQRGC